MAGLWCTSATFSAMMLALKHQVLFGDTRKQLHDTLPLHFAAPPDSLPVQGRCLLQR